MSTIAEICEALCCFKYKNQYYLCDIYSGLQLEVSSDMYNCVQITKTSHSKNIEEIRSLYKHECSFLEDAYKRGYISGKKELKEKETECATLSLTPIHECNFSCKYCFAYAGKSYEGLNREFNEKGIDATLEYFFSEYYPTVNRYRIEFVSGGEPLLSFEYVRYIIEHAENYQQMLNKPVQIWLCTNGFQVRITIVIHYMYTQFRLSQSSHLRKRYALA